MAAKPSIEVLSIGDDCRPIAIVDGLAQAPHRWRDEAVGDGYAYRGDFYPGRRRPVGPAYFGDTGKRLGAVMRSVFGCTRSLSVDRALYSIVSTDPADLALAQRVPHIDDCAPDSYAMVHYLSHGAFGGTAFFRHRRSGLAQVPAERHAEYIDALDADLAMGGEPAPGYIDGTTALFEQLSSVEFAYNRAVIYRGNLLHCSIVPPGIDHPDDAATGRLTIAAFFRAS
ncbi:MAG: DUF6445 family protein [Erythrobacter sp.]